MARPRSFLPAASRCEGGDEFARAAGFSLAAGALLILGSCADSAASTPVAPTPPAAIDSLDPDLARAVHAGVASVEQDPSDAARWLELGMLYQANGLPEEAAACLSASVSLAPEDALAWYASALVSFDLGDVTGARGHARRSLEIDPSYAPGCWRLGQWCLSDGDLDSAQAWFTRCTEVDPDHAGGWVGLARVHLTRGEAQEASKILERRVLHGPNDAYGRQLLAGAYHMLQREAEARVLASEGRGARPMFQDPRGGDILSRRVGRLPALQRAHALLGSGKAAQAVQILEAMRQAEPRDAAVLSRLGFALWKQGELEMALTRAREATGLDPADSAAWLTQARVVHRTAEGGDDAEALRLIDRALAAKPTSVDALTFRARLCLDRGDDPGALGAYIKARAQQPDNVTLLEQILAIQRRLQLWGDAVTTCESLLVLEPGDQGARVDLAGDLERVGDLVRAEELLRNALSSQLLFADEDHPDTRKILLELGDVLEAQGRDDDAYEVRRRIR